MDTYKTGNDIEKKAYDRLITQHYWVEKTRRARFQPQDFFYCWDFIAVSQKHIRFIQVSGKPFTQRSRRDKERMLAFPKPQGTIKEYWYWNEQMQRFEIQTI